MILVDTDILIWILRGREDIIVNFKTAADESNGILLISPIQISEIYAGMKENERVDTELFMESFTAITIDSIIARMAGDYLNKYRKKFDISLADALTGSSAKYHGVSLWTMNRRHYPMLKKNEFYH